MSIPASRQQFADYCLRQLGAPVINIDVSDQQVDDRIDEALLYFRDYHFDGTERVFYSHLITPTDITNKYITVPAGLIGVISIFSISDPSIRADDLFNIRYQIALNDLYSLTSVSMVPYYMVMQHLALVSEFLVGKQPIRFNRYTNQVWIDMDWTAVGAGQYILLDGYQVTDPNVYTALWGDRWLAKYTTALIKRQWGINLSKYTGVQLVGGITFNGDKIYNDAIAQIEALEHEMSYSYSLPPDMMIN